jgi:hypothetical protein
LFMICPLPWRHNLMRLRGLRAPRRSFEAVLYEFPKATGLRLRVALNFDRSNHFLHGRQINLYHHNPPIGHTNRASAFP